MFTLHGKQINIFKDAALKRFEDEMVEHIRAFFPNHYQAMQEQTARTVIQYGYMKAKSYDLNTIRNVCLYLNNMLLLGSNFDDDPQYPWAKEILTDKHIQNPMIRIDKLSDKTLEELGKVTGQNNIFIYRTILTFTKNSEEIFQQLTRSYLSKVLSHLKIIFKQKYEVVGESNLNEMIKYGIKKALKYDINQEPYIVVYIVFMFMMGSGFDEDPQYPWISKILNDQDLTDQRKKMEILYHTTIENLKYALSKYTH